MAAETAKRSMTGQLGWLTRATKAMNDLMNDGKIDNSEEILEEFRDKIEEIEDKLMKYERAVDDYIKLLDPIQDTALVTDVLNKSVDEIEKAKSAKRKGTLYKKKHSPSTMRARNLSGLNASATGGESSTVTSVRLPKLDLPTFEGKKGEWTGFWEAFETAVDTKDVPEITKFTYLLRQLGTEPARVVAGLALSADHYDIAVDLLKKRYGRKPQLIFEHIESLLEIRAEGDAKESLASLQDLLDIIQKHVRSLEKLGVRATEYGIFLTPLILSKLPKPVCLEWARDSENKEGDLEYLLKFLEKECSRRQRCELFSEDSLVDSPLSQPYESTLGQFGAPGGGQPPSQNFRALSGCPLHGRGHSLENCMKFKEFTNPEKQEIVREHYLCFTCLMAGHRSFDCKVKRRCRNCGKFGHHALLCRQTDPSQDKFREQKQELDYTKQGEQQEAQVVSMDSVRYSLTVLPTAKVEFKNGKTKCCKLTLLMDSGSDRSYVTTKVVDSCKLKWVRAEQNSYSSFGGDKTKLQLRNLYELDFGAYKIAALEINRICSPLKRLAIPPELLDKCAFLDQLADEYGRDRNVEIDVLIGMDFYWKLMETSVQPQLLGNGLVAQKTVFGWIVSGGVASESTTAHTSMNLSVAEDVMNVIDIPRCVIEDQWTLKGLGIEEEEMNTVLKEFRETIKYDEERKKYIVKLPRKSTMEDLVYSKELVRKFLEKMTKKLKEKGGDAQQDLEKYLANLEKEEMIIEITREEQVHKQVYLPQQVVFKEDSATTKVRPVVMAHIKGRNGLSINDCLEKGPNLLKRLEPILIRLRRWKVVLIGDVTKAFLCVGVAEEDQDLLRFLAMKDGVEKTYRYQGVPFGLRCSPFLLNATLQYHFEQQDSSSRCVQELQDNMYMDDWLTGADSVEEAQKMYQEATLIMNEAGMTLAKWSSNKKDVFEKEIKSSAEYTKVLGMRLDLNQDCFVFKGLKIEIPENKIVSKALVLSAVARLFDPLGLICPFEMEAKLIFQECWRRKLEWKEALDSDLEVRFKKWISDLEVLEGLRIPRQYADRETWDAKQVELWAYSDASTLAYGCCVYMVVNKDDGERAGTGSLVYSKGRVAPLKTVSLPRLELLGCKLAAEGVKMVINALHLPEDVKYQCRTDSEIALHWIRNSLEDRDKFIENRVEEIRDQTDALRWGFVAGVDNPADLITRGLNAKDLVSGPKSVVWFASPQRRETENKWTVTDDVITLAALEMQDGQAIETGEEFVEVFEIKRWSTLAKALRIVAYALRYVSNSRLEKGKRKFEPLTYQEFEAANKRIIRQEQKRYYLDEITNLGNERKLSAGSKLLQLKPFVHEGILRKYTRLDQGELQFAAKFPIILEGHLAKLILQFFHKIWCHAGVQALIATIKNAYWIIGLRRLAKNVKKDCIDCQIQDARAFNEVPAPLPRVRITRSAAFTVTGIDFAGPLFCVDYPGQEFSLCLFTCAVTRAVHCELCEAQSAEQTVMALRRMASYRSLPKIIYSDNAKGFQKSQKVLLDYFGPVAPEWRFIAPLSPWWGGWYERLIGSAKKAIRKTIGKRNFTRTELETTVAEVSAMMNSRPLTFVGDTPEAAKPLTPNDFLIGAPTGFEAALDEDGSTMKTELLAEREQIRLTYLDKCWTLWQNEYLKSLPVCVPGFEKRGVIKEGVMVLIRDDKICKLPRLKWPIGVVQKLFVGKDGLARAAEIKTAKSVLTRDIRRLHSLELYAQDLGLEEVDDKPTERNEMSNVRDGEKVNVEQEAEVPTGRIPVAPVVTRSGRKVKKREVLNLVVQTKNS